MQRVIEQKAQQRSERPPSYRAHASSRVVWAEEAGAVRIDDVTSTLYWKQGAGRREVVTGRRETPSGSAEVRLADVQRVPSFYDDNIRLGGFTYIGPTHPQAFRYYSFELEGRATYEGQRVYELSVRPRTNLQPAFSGQLRVLADSYLLLDVRLHPGPSVYFPAPVYDAELTYRQQFGRVEERYWLPLNFRVEGTYFIGLPGLYFPPLQYKQRSQITDYAFDVALPDSLFEGKARIAKAETPEVSAGDFLPRTDEEEAAYRRVEAQQVSMRSAFAPRGLLTRLGPVSSLLNLYLGVFEEEEEEGRASSSPLGQVRRGVEQLQPEGWFNRVDALHLGVAPLLQPTDRLALQGQLGYSTGLRLWTYGGRIEGKVGPDERGSLALDYHYGVDPRYSRGVEGERFENGMDMLGLGNLTPDEDYFDYYGNERWRLQAGYLLESLDARVAVGLRNERHFSVRKTSNFHLYGDVDPFGGLFLLGGVWDFPDTYRSNPAVEEGRLRSVVFEAGWRDGKGVLGRPGQRGVKAFLEYSPEQLGSDFDFLRLDLKAGWRITTFLQRRPQPNTLDLYLTAGASAGRPPLQRLGTIHGKRAPYEDLGLMRTLSVRPYQGEQYAALFWKHDFQTVPFELLGLDWLVRHGLSLSVNGAHGRTWIAEDHLGELPPLRFMPDGVHHEVGLALEGILGVVSVDVTKRLDAPGFDWSLDVDHLF